MSKSVNKLMALLHKHDMTLIGMLYEQGFWTVYAHNPKLVGKKPVMNECRDAQDYLLLLDQWKEKGEFHVFSSHEFDKAILGAIKAVKSY